VKLPVLKLFVSRVTLFFSHCAANQTFKGEKKLTTSRQLKNIGLYVAYEGDSCQDIK